MIRTVGDRSGVVTARSEGQIAWDAPGAERRFRPRDGRAAAVNHALLVAPALVTVGLFLRYHLAHQLSVDFHHDFWVAGFRVLHGLSPYDWTRSQIAGLASFPYPAPAALLFVPFSLLPRGIGDVTFALLTLLACLSALRFLQVRDWRLYMLVLLWWPVISGWQTANVTLLFVCGIAMLWRYRDRPLVAGALLAVMLAVKPVVWPLVLWLLVTRRFRVAALALAAALGLNVVAWAVLGFEQLATWTHLLMVQTDVLYREGYGLVALATHFGIGRSAGTVLQILASAALIGGCLHLGWQRRERDAFALAIALMLASSPLVDNHYFALLIVPLAITRPSLGRLWLVPLLLWLCPATGVAGWQAALAWIVLAGVTAGLLRDTGSGSAPRVTSPQPASSR
ncbi:MAG TPA: glycosyltransferase family 87 protein [Solirubrobacteraceae bacterium]